MGGDAQGEASLTGLEAAEVLLTVEAAASLRVLEASHDPVLHSVYRRVAGIRSILRSDCLHGEVVKKDRIPAELKAKYAIGNLYVEDLPAFWRLLYTVGRHRQQRYVTVVAIIDHGAYTRLFRRRHG